MKAPEMLRAITKLPAAFFTGPRQKIKSKRLTKEQKRANRRRQESLERRTHRKAIAKAVKEAKREVR